MGERHGYSGKSGGTTYITSGCHSAAEYVQAMENAFPLKAIDSSDKYKLLLEHNGIVLAEIDMGPQNGYQFVTWR